MAATKPLLSQVSQRRMQPTSFALEGRPMSSESLGTVRRKFLNAPAPEPPRDEGDQDEFYRPRKVSIAVGNKKTKKKKKIKKESFDPDIDEREKERLQELKEWLNSDADKSGIHHELKMATLKHMRVLDDLGKLKAHYYIEYMDALTDKVEDQRKDIQRTSELHRKRRLKKEKKERDAAQKAKILMHRPEVSSDNTFLRGLSRTKFHNMVILQDHLAREGRMRTDEHVRAYWEELSKPENYRRIFGEDGTEHQDGVGTSIGTKPPKIKEGEMLPGGDAESHATASDSIPESSTPPSIGSLHQLDPLHLGYLDQIQEVKEPSRPNSMGGPYVQSWIQQPKQKKKASPAPVTRKPVHPKVLEMEQKCPRVEFPKLAAFTLDLEPPKEDPEVESMREEFRSRARLRNSEVSRLRKMYQTSLTNNAATQRIFDMKGEFTEVLNGPSLGDVLYAQDPSEQLSLIARRLSEEEEEVDRTERLALLAPNATPHQGNGRSGSYPSRPSPGFAIERISEEGDLEDEEEDGKFIIYSSRSSSRRSSLTSTQSERRRNIPVTPEPPQPLPLTLGAVMDHVDTKVVKGPSALWVNYGKFLPSVK